MSAAPFKTGLVVADLERAMRDLRAALGLEWTPVQRSELTLALADGSRESVELGFAYSTGPGPYLELLEAQPAGYYVARPGQELHHVGFWADDLEAASLELVARGMRLEAAGVRDGHTPAIFAFHVSPHGLRVELVDSRMRPGFEGWLRGGELEL